MEKKPTTLKLLARLPNWAVAALCVVPFLGWWAYGLMDLDEGFYGSIAAEMNQRGEWLIPTLHGHPWFEKPIFIYWAIKPSLMLFGPMWGPRIPSILASLASIAMAWAFARRFLGEIEAKTVALILSSCLLFVAVGRMALTDPFLNFFLTATMLAIWLAQAKNSPPVEGWQAKPDGVVSLRANPWYLLAGASLGFAVLSKGPVALILVGIILGISRWRNPSPPDPLSPRKGEGEESTSTAPSGHLPLTPRGRIGNASDLSFPSNEGEVARPTGATVEVLSDPFSQPSVASPPKGGQHPSPPGPLSPRKGEGESSAPNVGQLALAVAIMLAVIALWYVPAYLKQPQVFVQEFLINQNLRRFTGGDDAHNLGSLGLLSKLGNLVVYLPVLFVGMLPWSIAALRSIRAKPADPLGKYLITWAAVVFVFFSVSGTKLPHYILPCVVPIALLAAKQIRGWEREYLPFAPLVVGAIAIFGFPAWYQASGQAEQLAILQNLPKGGSVVGYQLPRREKELGTGQLKIRETSLPSTGLYAAPRPWIEADSLNEAFELQQPIWVLTRPGRLNDRDRQAYQALGWSLELVPGQGGEHYQLYRLQRRMSQ